MLGNCFDHLVLVKRSQGSGKFLQPHVLKISLPCFLNLMSPLSTNCCTPLSPPANPPVIPAAKAQALFSPSKNCSNGNWGKLLPLAIVGQCHAILNIEAEAWRSGLWARHSRIGPTASLSGYLRGSSRMDLPFCPDFLRSSSLQIQWKVLIMM